MQHKVSASYGDKKCDKKHTVSASDLKYRAVFGLVEITVESRNFHRNDFLADGSTHLLSLDVFGFSERNFGKN